MSEHDELWKPDDRETDEHMQMRMRRALDRMFGTGGASETCESSASFQCSYRNCGMLDISITGHSAIFRNLLAVLNHQVYPLATGEMIPVVVRATKTTIAD